MTDTPDYDFSELDGTGSWWNAVVPEVVELERDGDHARFDADGVGGCSGDRALLTDVLFPVVGYARELTAEMTAALTLAATRAGCEVTWWSGGEPQGSFTAEKLDDADEFDDDGPVIY